VRPISSDATEGRIDVVKTDEAVVEADETVVEADEASVKADGAAVKADGAAVRAEGAVVRAEGATVAGDVTGEADSNFSDATGIRCATRRVAIMPAVTRGARASGDRSTGIDDGSLAAIGSSAAMSGDENSAERSPRRTLRRDATRP